MGTFSVMHTDHVNSTLMPVELRNPDKILRMLLYLESSLQLTWRFVSGIANPAGDGFSRNPVDRDKVKTDIDSRPRTFGDAWEMARGSVQSCADTDFLIRSFVVGRPDFRWHGFEPICVRPQYDGKPLRYACLLPLHLATAMKTFTTIPLKIFRYWEMMSSSVLA